MKVEQIEIPKVIINTPAEPELSHPPYIDIEEIEELIENEKKLALQIDEYCKTQIKISNILNTTNLTKDIVNKFTVIQYLDYLEGYPLSNNRHHLGALLRNGLNISLNEIYDILNKKSFYTTYDTIYLLLKYCNNINQKDSQGNTILMKCDLFSISKNDHTVVPPDELKTTYKNFIDFLCKLGVNINATNNLGMTALMKYSLEGNTELVKILIEYDADTNITSSVTALDLATNQDIKNILKNVKNHIPQNVVKILKNFTIDKPLKYTTHKWDFSLQEEYKDFDGYMSAVTQNFNQIEKELEELSPNLHKKIKAFIFETDIHSEYSWCSKANINISWSNIDGLKQWCDDGKNPFDFKLKKPIKANGKVLKKFEDIINLFKQEIEIRSDFKTLRNIFDTQKKKLDDSFMFEPSKSKLEKQFYTDTQNLSNAIDLIFTEINKLKEYKTIEVKTKELNDRSIEIYITQIDSRSSKSAKELLNKVEDEGGDLYNIKNNLTNLCDWSIEASSENKAFRINLLHSNNVKDIVELQDIPDGFTHILRFYR